ncbi:MAG TPA: CHAP domain-containing protein [Stellaceae bacterium]|jgi:surface antigen|nr:CHAP domain-containing protein [Stellaceae bacterium]
MRLPRALAILILLLPLLLDACASGRLQCAPYARAISAVDLYGDGGDWWQEATGRYRRSQLPMPGAVLVWRRSSRLPEGHVAVVSRVVSAREILVDHADWAPGRISKAAPVIDVSAENDWSLVRVWWPPSGQMGITRYPTWGFILPVPASPGALQVSARPALHMNRG